MGTEELVVKDTAHYVELVSALGADPAKRARMRSELTKRSAVLYQSEAAVADLACFLRLETRNS
jgi:predicted O-linked N-acetylglucosamine transferase (SPINDLY family)